MSNKAEEVQSATASVVYTSPTAVLFSELAEKQLGLKLSWRNWRPRFVEVLADGTLVIRREETRDVYKKFNASDVDATNLDFSAHQPEDAAGTFNPLSNPKEVGILLKLKSAADHETQIRFITTEVEKEKFYESLRRACTTHNLDNVRRASLSGFVGKKKRRLLQVSAMRSAVASAMDSYDSSHRKEHIIAKRGAFKWLPVFFASDLVHGSWWFVIGSIAFAVTSGLVIQNTYDHSLGEDDSILTDGEYRETWLLMTISGIFCTLGSMAFIRAVHEDPPMEPLFTWYHLQSDELLGSWLFLFATLPIIPYTLIYLFSSDFSAIFLVALAIAIVFVIGSYMFVRACYPSTVERRELIRPVAYVACYCFCKKEWIENNLYNDWLAGTWFIYWGTLFAFIVCFLFLIVAIADNKSLQIYIMATGLFENWCFLVGSVYFIAGSYPEGGADAEEGGEEDEESGKLPKVSGPTFSKKVNNNSASSSITEGLRNPIIRENDQF